MTVTHHCRTGKRTYRDLPQAKRVVTRARQSVDHGHQAAHVVPVRAYQCPFCKRYHLTSQE